MTQVGTGTFSVTTPLQNPPPYGAGAVVDTADDGVRDFSAPQRDTRFKIKNRAGGYDYFEGINDLPAMLLVEFAAAMDAASEAEVAKQPEIFADLFRLILNDESITVFLARMRDRDNPISLTQVTDILPWLMEKYGMRPTGPSESSSDGSAPPASGTSSTASSPATASTSADSTPTGS